MTEFMPSLVKSPNEPPISALNLDQNPAKETPETMARASRITWYVFTPLGGVMDVS